MTKYRVESIRETTSCGGNPISSHEEVSDEHQKSSRSRRGLKFEPNGCTMAAHHGNTLTSDHDIFEACIFTGYTDTVGNDSVDGTCDEETETVPFEAEANDNLTQIVDSMDQALSDAVAHDPDAHSERALDNLFCGQLALLHDEYDVLAWAGTEAEPIVIDDD